jgi:Hermansky-Pudlak syndrome 3
MVRVMSIYHFASQSIEQLSIEELSASCLIPPDFIILAKNSDHIIEIRKLKTPGEEEESSSSKTTKSFSSVDDVQQLIFSRYGNFIISVESRISNYEKSEIRYVRIYVNWDLSTPSSSSSSTSQTLRARIAGKITPMKKSEFENIFKYPFC